MTTSSLDEIATVLETAADLYESEKIGWCSGRWLKTFPASKMSACAEGALLLAAGFDWKDVQASGDNLFLHSQLANDAKRVLEEGLCRSLHGWNDFYIGGRRIIKDNGGEAFTFTEANPAKAKSEVIELMKNTAKDLRNRQGAA